MSFWEKIKSWFCRSKNGVTLDTVINHSSEISENDLAKILDGAKDNKVESELFAGVLYLKGVRIPQDCAKALEYLDRSAQSGNVSAQKILAKEYMSGVNFPQDLAKAVELFQKASLSGDVEALHNLGLMYEEGISVEKDINKAVEYLQKASDAGYVEARVEIADMYYEGVDLPIDRLKACQLYKSVLSQDTSTVDIGRIYHLLGQAYSDKSYECGLTREEGIDFLKKAIDKEYFDSVRSLAFISDELDQGDRNWFFGFVAQHQDNPRCIFAMGICYEKGFGTFQDDSSAFNCYKKAAELGDPWAMHYAACSYLEGRGIEKSVDEWLRLESQAAEQGVPLAQYSLGVCYLKGDNVEKDDEKAMRFLKMAADNHYNGAIKILQDIQGSNGSSVNNLTQTQEQVAPQVQEQLQEQVSPKVQDQPDVQTREQSAPQGGIAQEQVQVQPQEQPSVNTTSVEAIEQQNKPKLEYRNSEDFH